MLTEEAWDMLPLTYANKNETNIIKKVSGKPEVRQHLADLGCVAWTPINVISDVNGALIVCVKDTKVALDKQLASKIMI